jgi:hypothetical protein
VVDADHSLLGLLRVNYRTVTEALGGDASAFDGLDLPAPVGDARYPQ